MMDFIPLFFITQNPEFSVIGVHVNIKYKYTTFPECGETSSWVDSSLFWGAVWPHYLPAYFGAPHFG